VIVKPLPEETSEYVYSIVQEMAKTLDSEKCMQLYEPKNKQYCLDVFNYNTALKEGNAALCTHISSASLKSMCESDLK